MSFGVSLGDIALTIGVICEAAKRYRRAPGEIKAQTKDVASFISALTPYALDNKAPAQHQEATEPQVLVQDCLSVLYKIQNHLAKSNLSGNGLTARTKRFIKRISSNQAGLTSLWEQFDRYIYVISLLIELKQNTTVDEKTREADLDSISKPLDSVPGGLDGTFQNFLKSRELQTWESQAGQGLLCHGRPGVGKTTFTSMVEKQLLEKYHDDPDVGVVCIYLCIDRHSMRTLDEIQCAILRHLCQKKVLAIPELRNFREGQLRPTGVKLLGVVLRAVKAYKRVFLLIDGIDEFGTSMADTRVLLGRLLIMQSESATNLLLTSLAALEIMGKLASWPKLEIRASDKDIVKFIDSKTTSLSANMLENDRVPDEIVRCIIDISDGMFLLPSCLMEEVRHMIEEIQDGITRQTTSMENATLQAIYTRLKNKFECQNPRQVARGKQTILWVLLAARPLSDYELCQAFEMKIGKVDVGYLTQATRSFVIRCPKSDIVKMFHWTAGQYLRWAWKAELPVAHMGIAKTLVEYLVVNGVKGGLYEYAATNWGFHAAKASEDEHMLASIMEFLRNKQKVYESCEVLLPYHISGRHPKAISGAHLAAHFGLISCLTTLAAESTNLDDRDENGETPLLWAARNCREDAVIWLLERGVDVDVRDFELKSILHYAALYRWERPLRLLLGRNARLTDDIKNMTPLHYAVKSGWKEGIVFFLDAGVEIDIRVRRKRYKEVFRDGRRAYERLDTETSPEDVRGRAGLTPLHFAALCGQQEMVHFLLDRGADPTVVSEHGETALHMAVSRGLKGTGGLCANDHWSADQNRLEINFDLIDISDEEEYDATRQFILEELSGLIRDIANHPATDVNARTLDGSQALHLVGYSDQKSATPLARLLLEHGADASGRNSKQQTPLLLACKRGNAAAARLLLDHGADVTEADDKACNALHYAAMSGRERTLLLVLEKSNLQAPDFILSQDVDCRNVLHHVLSDPCLVHCETVQKLLEQGAQINTVDKGGMTPLVTYISQSFLLKPEGVVELLLRWGADVSYKTSDRGWGLGHIYADSLNLDVEVLKLLADAGVDLRAVDAEGKTILHHSAHAGSLTQPAFEFLLNEIGLSPDVVDSAGRKALEYAQKMSNKKWSFNTFDPNRWSRTEKIIMGE